MKPPFLASIFHYLRNCWQMWNQNIPQRMYSQGLRKKKAIFVNLLVINLFHTVFLINHILQFLPILYDWITFIVLGFVSQVLILLNLFVLSLGIILYLGFNPLFLIFFLFFLIYNLEFYLYQPSDLLTSFKFTSFFKKCS